MNEDIRLQLTKIGNDAKKHLTHYPWQVKTKKIKP